MTIAQTLEWNADPPVQQWIRPEFSGLQVRVLRADASHPWLQGNKVWKLSPFLENAVETGADGLVSVGGAFSNHLISLAYAGFRLGKSVHCFIRGEESEWGNNPAVRQMRAWGAHLYPISRTSFRELRLFPENWKSILSVDGNRIFVPLGGSSPVSLPSISTEATRWFRREPFDVLVLPVASGGTLAGLAMGLPDSVQLMGIEVVKTPHGLGADLERLWVGVGFSRCSGLVLSPAYHFGGYGRVTPELVRFCRQINAEEKFQVEPIYSGKAFYAVSDLAKKGYFREGSRILVVHTGGIFPWNLDLLGA